ncbi:hypothetical protein [Gordonia sp. 'Campus']|uniref:hypothetical protein n=1 Tax=Gordonia sp. 'Campus' TaxID=2915824 RepID=UPI001EE3CA89|nr:hypothetical protein [Gordonia sp. 'Campus']
MAALTTVTPDDVRLLDAPTAECLDVILAMAKRGDQPAPVLLNAEMMRHGLYAGHHGELVKQRVIDSVTIEAPGVRLMEYAAAVLAEVVRERMISAAAAIAERARDGAETDAWQTFVREGVAVRGLWERLCHARGVAA